MNNECRDLSIGADRLGIIASAVCFVHCILTPVLLSISAVWAHYLPSEERVHRGLAVVVAGIGGFAILGGYRKHRRARVLLLMCCGLLFIFAGAYWGDRLPSHVAEVAVTMTGSCLMIAAHFINHTFCKNCRRCDETRGDQTSQI
jgi:uncharacterized membrane protein YfcA